MKQHRKDARRPGSATAFSDGCTRRLPGAAGTEKLAPALEQDSTIVCPQCGTATRVHMPTDACQFFWECPACGALLKPQSGDCCVFCSWGSVPCPPVQAGRARCA